MSAAPIYNEYRQPRPPQRNPQRNRRPVKKQNVFASACAQFAVHGVLFLAVSGITLGFSSLAGHSMKEGARRDAIRATQRAKVARADAGHVRARLERLSTLKAVDEWTKVNGFVPGYQFAKVTTRPKAVVRTNLVARNDSDLKVDILVARVDNGSEAR